MVCLKVTQAYEVSMETHSSDHVWICIVGGVLILARIQMYEAWGGVCRRSSTAIWLVELPYRYGAGGKTISRKDIVSYLLKFERETSQSTLLLSRIDRHPGSEQIQSLTKPKKVAEKISKALES